MVTRHDQGWVGCLVFVALSMTVLGVVVYMAWIPRPDEEGDLSPLKNVAVSSAKEVWMQGDVIAVNDGDTLTLKLDDNLQYKIRLMGIDAPESSQPWGEVSREVLRGLVLNKQVFVAVTAEDRYGRRVAWVYPGEIPAYEHPPKWAGSINGFMLGAGLAWHYKSYDTDELAARIETRARSIRIGLWSEEHPEPPWDYRRRK
jgi:micrococcal nuclease